MLNKILANAMRLVNDVEPKKNNFFRCDERLVSNF